MDAKEAIRRLKEHFRIHNDGRPTPLLDEAVNMAIEALEKQTLTEKSCKNCLYGGETDLLGVFCTRQSYTDEPPVLCDKYKKAPEFHDMSTWW